MVSLWHVYNIRSWKDPGRVIAWDVISYYAYLPATFIYHDITLKFIDRGTDYPEVLFWPNYTSDNQYVIKTSMGMAYLYAPFFFLAHATVGLTEYNPSGFSPHYKYFLVIGGIIFYLAGLIFLRKILIRYFDQLTAFLALITITLGTNLMYYSGTEVTMPHVYIFALTNIFLYLTIKWHESPGILKAIFIGILTGIISLIRPTNIIILLIFILFGIRSWDDLRSRTLLFGKYFHHLILIGLLTILIWIPQFIYWKTVTGQWIFFSYIGERFFFLKPQIINGLFSFRKGWLVYTPVMLFALAGIPVLWRQRREFFWPVLILLIAHVYIIYSWWCWWYGGSLGSRPMIDIYGLLAIPVAAFLKWTFNRKGHVKLILITLFLLMGLKGSYFNIQYYYGSVHWDGMTGKAYFKSFFRTRKYDELEKLIKVPDYTLAKEGKEDYFLK
ncbi:MAG: hypothetical protein AMS27_07830 [Bacteroides sp. SM23_62_1]|nr:MAG: hypothetical protein AMS27_07830 [Bacteroides sp. SM23_62_1]